MERLTTKRRGTARVCLCVKAALNPVLRKESLQLPLPLASEFSLTQTSDENYNFSFRGLLVSIRSSSPLGPGNRSISDGL